MKTIIENSASLAPHLLDSKEHAAASVVDVGYTTTPDYLLRHIEPSDHPLILSSWSKGAYEAAPNHFIPKDIWFPHQYQHITKCLKSFNTLVMCHYGDPNELFGYVCYSFVSGVLLVHWFYVKKDFRHKGMMTEVLAEIAPTLNIGVDPIIITQYHKYYESLKDKFNLFYDPYYVLEH